MTRAEKFRTRVLYVLCTVLTIAMYHQNSVALRAVNIAQSANAQLVSTTCVLKHTLQIRRLGDAFVAGAITYTDFKEAWRDYVDIYNRDCADRDA